MSMTRTPFNKRTGGAIACAGLLLCLVLATTACGQRGPLYLPDKESKAPATETQTAEEEKDGEENEETP